jgi:hypothetical protein
MRAMVLDRLGGLWITDLRLEVPGEAVHWAKSPGQVLKCPTWLS